ncbi:type II secretion system F family protein [Paenisporosarcina quisquiliarum]|uniref:type II secretion system F family protein n=1 Tax=Paenisporosarcina quisquiliarum TaxID=365346 RepID=UPI003735214B
MIELFALITISLVLLGLVLARNEAILSRKQRIALVIGEERQEKVVATTVNAKESLFQRLFDTRIKQFKRSFNRTNKRGKAEKIERKLLQAGTPYSMTPFEFRILQLGLLIVLPIFMFIVLVLANVSIGKLLFMLLATIALSMYLPHAFLKMKIKSRNHKAIVELSDFIDLLAVSMEAGLGFDQALSKVVSKKHGVLADEFQRCLEELRLGKTRRESLAGVRDRLQVDDIQMLIGNIIQAEQLGIGMVQILRIQSEEVRIRRKQRAEEKAMKAPIKMLFPLVIFIFPCIFIILLGPVLLQLMETFM